MAKILKNLVRVAFALSAFGSLDAARGEPILFGVRDEAPFSTDAPVDGKPNDSELSRQVIIYDSKLPHLISGSHLSPCDSLKDALEREKNAPWIPYAFSIEPKDAARHIPDTGGFAHIGTIADDKDPKISYSFYGNDSGWRMALVHQGSSVRSMVYPDACTIIWEDGQKKYDFDARFNPKNQAYGREGVNFNDLGKSIEWAYYFPLGAGRIDAEIAFQRMKYIAAKDTPKINLIKNKKIKK